MKRITPFYVASITVLFFVFLQAAGSIAHCQSSGNGDQRAKLSGIWVYDSKKSTTRASLKPLYKDQSLTISLAEPKIEIKKVQTKDGETKEANLILFTDKRGEANNPFPFNESQRIESVTEWDENSLVRVSAAEIPSQGSKIKINIREKFTVSEDGNTLTITEETFTNSPALPFPDRTKKVYQRK
jgi:hypothetical protein